MIYPQAIGSLASLGVSANMLTGMTEPMKAILLNGEISEVDYRTIGGRRFMMRTVPSDLMDMPDYVIHLPEGPAIAVR